MSCGIVNEHASNVRSIPVSEAVPWKDRGQIKKSMLRHNDKIYHELRYHPEGRDSALYVTHSIWHSNASLESFVKINPGSGEVESQ